MFAVGLHSQFGSWLVPVRLAVDMWDLIVPDLYRVW